MAVKSSGTLTYTDIKTEFGNSTGNKLGNYRVTQPLVQNGVTFRQFTLDGQTIVNGVAPTGSIPTSGTIKFSDFYSKRLTHVVDIFSPGSNVQNFLNAKKIFTNNPNRVIVIGPKTSSQRRPNGGGSKVIIVVNKTVGSEKGNGTKCALRTGVWDTSCNLEVILDANARLYGAGGDGGAGAEGNVFEDANGDEIQYPGNPGAAGTSGLGIEFGSASNQTKITMSAGAIISAGFGGGGGGRGGYEGTKNTRYAGGGGGGGGAGIPAGNGGAGGVATGGAQDPDVADREEGSAGSGASTNVGGTPGGGGNNHNEAGGAAGGYGGQFTQRTVDGVTFATPTAGGDSETEGGAVGANGHAIRKGTNAGISFTIVGKTSNNVRGTEDSGTAGVAGSGVFQGT